MLQILWNFLSYQGVSHVSHVSEHKHVVLVNTLALLVPLFTLINLLTVITLGIPTALLLGSVFYILLLPFAITLNASGKLLISRIYLFLLSFGYITLIAVSQGSQARTHFFFLSEALVVFFVFPNYEKKWKYSLVLFLLLVFSGFDIMHESMVPFIYVPPEKIKILSNVTDISFAVLTIGFAFYIHSIFQKTELFVQLEHAKSEKLLQNILPLSIIKKLRENPDTIAERFEDCTVLFSDIVGFTEMSKSMSAVSVVSLLNEVFSRFDDLAEKYGLEKIKTIGDAYMVVGGLPEPDFEHVERVASFALEMLEVIKEYRRKNDVPLELRIGINSGDAVAGVIGKKKFIYDLWGDSVNTASRMESHGLPGQIHVSESTYARLKDRFEFTDRGRMEVKGLGSVQSYLLLSRNP